MAEVLTMPVPQEQKQSLDVSNTYHKTYVHTMEGRCISRFCESSAEFFRTERRARECFDDTLLEVIANCSFETYVDRCKHHYNLDVSAFKPGYLAAKEK